MLLLEAPVGGWASPFAGRWVAWEFALLGPPHSSGYGSWVRLLRWWPQMSGLWAFVLISRGSGSIGEAGGGFW